MAEILNIYKTDEWTAQIVTDESGYVLDCIVIPRPMSEFERRIRERRKYQRVWTKHKEVTNDNQMAAIHKQVSRT